MSRLELSGYVQIVIGLVGIIVTLLTAPTILDAFGQLTGGHGLPSEFNSVSGGIRIFAVMVVLAMLVMLVVIGASITLSTLFTAAGAGRPMLAASCVVVGVFGMALCATFGALQSLLWIPAFVGSLGVLLVGAASMGTKDPSGETAATIAALFIVIFLMTGLGTVASMNKPDDQLIDLNADQAQN
jgi:hypothetical protein